jgi:hypothetical protein
MSLYKYQELKEKDEVKKSPLVVTIDGFPNYEVDTDGNVWNRVSGKRLIPVDNGKGYEIVGLHKDNKKYNQKIHRLVAKAFIKNPKNKEQVDHINNNRTDNSVYNLRWATRQENGFNSSMSSNNTSGVKGVCYHKRVKKWQAFIKINGKLKFIGYYDEMEDATEARKLEAQRLFGKYCHKSER